MNKTEFNPTPATSLFPPTQISTTKGYGDHGFIKFILLSDICSSKDGEIYWARLKYGGEKMDTVKPEGKRSLGRPGQRTGNNDEVQHEARVRDKADWIHVVRDSEKRQAFVITVMNTLVSINVGIS